MFGAAVLLPLFFLCVLSSVRKELKTELLFFPYPQDDTGEYLVGIRVDNPSRIYLDRVSAKIRIRNMATGNKRWLKVAGQLPAETVTELKGKLQNAEFGLWEAECEVLYCYEWMNFLYLSKKISSKKQVMIFPDVHEVNLKIGIRTRLFWSDGEQYHPQVSGDDPSETLKLREYQSGDRLNRIHWKLSAKNSSLIVAEMSMPMNCNIVCFLDANPSVMKKKEAKTYWEVVNTISQGLLNQECAYYLVWKNRGQKELCRKAVRKVEDLADFWSEISSASMEKGADSETYARDFSYDYYASGLLWNEKLELFCNEKFLVKIRPEQIRRQLAELEIVL